MFLARFYLPLHDNEGVRFPKPQLQAVEAELTRRFGGVTAHLQSPARGLWQDSDKTHADDVVTFEVICEKADRNWWLNYRRKLAHEFGQKRILLMMHSVDVI